jgi:hypothetical protein
LQQIYHFTKALASFLDCKGHQKTWTVSFECTIKWRSNFSKARLKISMILVRSEKPHGHGKSNVGPFRSSLFGGTMTHTYAITDLRSRELLISKATAIPVVVSKVATPTPGGIADSYFRHGGKARKQG